MDARPAPQRIPFRSIILILAGCILSMLGVLTSDADPPEHYCSMDLADSGAVWFTPPDPMEATRALVIFVKFADDTINHWAEQGWTCYSTGGWDKTIGEDVPAWADSFLAPHPFDEDSTFYNGSLSDYFDEMSMRQHWLWGHVYNFLPESLTGISDSSVYVPVEDSLFEMPFWYDVNHRILEDIDTSKAGSDTSGLGIDFSQYDTNPQDGFVDQIFMVYRFGALHHGYPHADSLEGIAAILANSDTIETNDTVVVGQDTILVKIAGGNFGSGSTMGYTVNKNRLQTALAHEYGHHLFEVFERGGEEYYYEWHLSYESQLGVMDGSGSGNAMSGFERAYLGWISPDSIITPTSDTTITLHDCITSGDLVKLPVPGRTDEYFLIENRMRDSYYDLDQRTQYGDSICVVNTLRAEGIFITHVDSLGSSNYYEPQNRPEHRKWSRHTYVDVECADGLWDTTGTDAQPDSGYYDDLDLNPVSPPSNWASDSFDSFNETNGDSLTRLSNPNSNAYHPDYTDEHGFQTVCTGIRLYDITTNQQQRTATFKISFVSDTYTTLECISTDRSDSAGTQLFVCPWGDSTAYMGAIPLTYEVTLKNDCGDPVSGFPGSKIRLTLGYGEGVFVGDGTTSCTPQTFFIGSGTTDANGKIQFEIPWVGGHGTGLSSQDISAVVRIWGRAVTDTLWVELRSPDIDGDGKVNIIDFAWWSSTWGADDGEELEIGDFDYDVFVDIIDQAVFAAHWGHNCDETQE